MLTHNIRLHIWEPPLFGLFNLQAAVRVVPSRDLPFKPAETTYGAKPVRIS